MSGWPALQISPVGATLPSTVRVYEVPRYEYRYASVNGQTVLVEKDSNKVVYVYR